MIYKNDLPNHRIEDPTSIPRSPSTFDLASLSHKTSRTFHKSRNRQSVSFAGVHRSECYGSENSQILYMVGPSKRSRKSRGSLSSIGNRPTRIMDGSSDTKTDCEEDSIGDEFTWNVIDREIFEWQHVCRTGRPYWWSPESKYSRLKKLPARLLNEPLPRPCMREIDDCPKDDYNKKRRAISDSYLAGKDCIDDLARLIAIQLLGSCFTLPPDHNGLPAPDYSSYNLNGPPNSPDPRLISSLRMHTQFRYSPCFGHQARNPSPAQLWSGAYDGPSPSSSPPFIAAGFQTPVIGTSGSPPRRRRVHRALNVTEGSASSCSLDNQSDDYIKPVSKSDLDPTASAMAWYRRQGLNDEKACLITLPYLPRQPSRRRQRPNVGRPDDDMLESYRGVQCSSRSPITNYRLQPVIRSEPHPVFVQPVKELVIKRWRTFRRRFGGSLNAPLPTDPEEFMSEASSPVQSELSSPATNSDGKVRRRRARERGEIHSSSLDSTTHYNSPVSGYMSPSGNEYPHPFWVDSANTSPTFQIANPLAAAAALALTETQDRSVQSSNSTFLNSSMPSDNIQRGSVSAGDDHGRTQSKMTLNPSAHSYTNRIRKRHHRRSMLPEMHSPEDFTENITNGETSNVDRNGLSATESAFQSPEEAESDVVLAIRSRASESIGNLGPMGSFSVRRMTVSSDSRPSLALRRTSTTGTQVFTPSDDGVELDGLPTGPSKELWNNRGKRREWTYL